MLKRVSYFLVFALCLLVWGEIRAQKDAGNPIEKRGFYRTMNMYGAYVHTRGFGAYYRRGWRQTGFVNKIYNVELLNVNHPKQYKIDVGARGYHYGKINSVYFVRNSFGWQKTWFDKEVKRGVRVSWFFMFGPTLALVKPIYVNVTYEIDPKNTQDATERYDFEKHSDQVQVEGRAPFLLGINQTKIIPGLHTKFALNFEYSGNDETIRALETGVNFDAFPKEVPIMASTSNDPFFLTVYIALHLGKRYL